MTKRIITFTLMVLFVALMVFAAEPKSTDSVSATTDSVTTASAASSGGLEIVEIENVKYLIHNGTAYSLNDLNESNHNSSDLNEEINNRLEEMNRQLRRQNNNSGNNTLYIVMVLFMIPCGTILAVLVLLLNFLQKRNDERNKVVVKAIEANYTLPDAYFTARQDSEFQHGKNGVIIEETRDPRKFSSAMTLIAIGLGIIIFFVFNDAPAGAGIGCIPLFLGIGRLIGYYFIKGYNTENLNSGRRGGYRGGYQSSQGYFGGDYRQNTNNGGCPPPPPGYNHTDNQPHP